MLAKARRSRFHGPQISSASAQRRRGASQSQGVGKGLERKAQRCSSCGSYRDEQRVTIATCTRNLAEQQQQSEQLQQQATRAPGGTGGQESRVEHSRPRYEGTPAPAKVQGTG